VNRNPGQYSETDDAYDRLVLIFLIRAILLGLPASFPAKDGMDPARQHFRAGQRRGIRRSDTANHDGRKTRPFLGRTRKDMMDAEPSLHHNGRSHRADRIGRGVFTKSGGNGLSLAPLLTHSMAVDANPSRPQVAADWRRSACRLFVPAWGDR